MSQNKLPHIRIESSLKQIEKSLQYKEGLVERLGEKAPKGLLRQVEDLYVQKESLENLQDVQKNPHDYGNPKLFVFDNSLSYYEAFKRLDEQELKGNKKLSETNRESITQRVERTTDAIAAYKNAFSKYLEEQGIECVQEVEPETLDADITAELAEYIALSEAEKEAHVHAEKAAALDTREEDILQKDKMPEKVVQLSNYQKNITEEPVPAHTDTMDIDDECNIPSTEDQAIQRVERGLYVEGPEMPMSQGLYADLGGSYGLDVSFDRDECDIPSQDDFVREMSVHQEQEVPSHIQEHEHTSDLEIGGRHL